MGLKGRGLLYSNKYLRDCVRLVKYTSNTKADHGISLLPIVISPVSDIVRNRGSQHHSLILIHA